MKPAEIRALAKVMADMGITELHVGPVMIRRPLVLPAPSRPKTKAEKKRFVDQLESDEKFKEFDEGILR